MRTFVIKKTDIKSGRYELGKRHFKEKIVAFEIANKLNESKVNKNKYIHTVVEVIDVVQDKKYECEMSDKELREFREDILAIQDDLRDNILSYDEWSALEYGENSVDTYFTALNLYNAGYRKVIEMKDVE